MDALKREMRFSAVIKMVLLFRVINTSLCLAGFFEQTHSSISFHNLPQKQTQARALQNEP